ncbi:MAG TPA: J domain-containing protein [Kofleriaceae bacterium]|nr:J domain-containing protein [Kofleriaceae bacterium]
MRVLIAVADVGSGVQLEEALTRIGIEAAWDGSQADGPQGAGSELVILDADHLGKRLAAVANAWRDHPSVPGLVAIGASAVAREQAPQARVTLLSPSASASTLTNALREAAKLRLAAGVRWPVMRAALKLPPADNEPAAWPATLLHARNVPIEIARSALRWHALHYVTGTDVLEHVREERILTVPELETIEFADGTLTVQSLVKCGSLDPAQNARLIWTLASLGALDLTPEVRDLATAPRRALAEIRANLRARTKKLANATHYDVLEITPLAEYADIENAYRLVAARYSPQVLAKVDLADLEALVAPIWKQIEDARATLVDDAARGRYGDWMRANKSALDTVWVVDPSAVKAAADAFARGQRTLGEGDVHRAMSDLAMACRHHPGHPDYEANLSWARFRVQVASGKDQREAAAREREIVEDVLAGRRPWPRALVALALLCAAGGDADAARWHLRTALIIDPQLPAAVALAQRLGMRR